MMLFSTCSNSKELSNNSVNHVRTFFVAELILLLLVIMMGSITFVMFYPFNPIQILSVTLLQHEVEPGNTIPYQIHMIKNTNMTSQINRFIVPMENDEGIMSIVSTVGGSVPGNTTKTIYAPIPIWVKPGWYKIRSVVQYEYFGIRKVVIKYETPCFKVVERK